MDREGLRQLTEDEKIEMILSLAAQIAELESKLNRPKKTSRNSVIHRKVTGGLRSDAGADAFVLFGDIVTPWCSFHIVTTWLVRIAFQKKLFPGGGRWKNNGLLTEQTFVGSCLKSRIGLTSSMRMPVAVANHG
jgi:hypothetical protein